MHFTLEKEDLGFFCVCYKTQAADIALVAVNTHDRICHILSVGVFCYIFTAKEIKEVRKSL